MEAIDFIDSFHGLLHCFMFLRIPQCKEFWVLHEFWIQMIARNSLHVAGKKFSFAVSRQKQIKKDLLLFCWAWPAPCFRQVQHLFSSFFLAGFKQAQNRWKPSANNPIAKFPAHKHLLNCEDHGTAVLPL